MQAVEKNSASHARFASGADEASAPTRAEQFFRHAMPRESHLLLIPQGRDRIHAAGAERGDQAGDGPDRSQYE
jgi:hypothetical protein